MHDKMRQFFTVLRSASSDFSYDIKDLISEGDKVVVRSTLRGTHDGDFFDVPASGNEFAVSTIDIYQVNGGKISRHWGIVDNAGLVSQMRAAPRRNPVLEKLFA